MNVILRYLPDYELWAAYERDSKHDLYWLHALGDTRAECIADLEKRTCAS